MISLTSSLVVEKTKYFPYKTHYENQKVCYIIGKKKCLTRQKMLISLYIANLLIFTKTR